MSQKGVYFNGKWITHPGAYATIDGDNMLSSSAGSERIVALLGSAKGGIPQEVMFFSNPSDAKRVLKDGELLKACELAWNPGGGEGGASTIAVIRVTPATQAQYDIKASATVLGNLKSKDYGLWTNRIQAKMEAGTTAGTKKLVVQNGETGAIEMFDDLGSGLNIKYTGAEVYADVTIAAGKLSTKKGAAVGTAVADFEIDLAGIDDIYGLVDEINKYAGYQASVNPKLSRGIPAIKLDAKAATSIKETALLTAVLGDLEKKVNNSSVLVEYNSVAAGTPDNFQYIALSGAVDGAVPSSWVELFDKLSVYPINYVVPLSSDLAVQAEARGHVTTMSNTMGRERIAIMGGAIATTVDEVKSLAIAHNSDRVQYAFPGIYDFDSRGTRKLYPSYITAAMVAGRHSWKPVGESSTFSYFGVTDLEFQLTPSEISALVESGVACFEMVVSRNGNSHRLVQDILTYTKDTKSLYTERSVRDLADSMNRELREKIEREIIGKKGVQGRVTSTQNLVESYLEEKIRAEWIVAFKDVRVSYHNRVMDIEYAAAPVEPINFALVSGHFYTADTMTGNE